MREAVSDPIWRGVPGGGSVTVARRRWVLPAALTGRDALLLSALLIVAARLFLALPGLLGVDSWLELVAGRLIWHTGVPHHETLTLLATGRPWIDQQWLSQLAAYGLYEVGGLALLGVANVTLLMSALGIAVATARSRGSSLQALLLPLGLAAWLLLPATEIRTQAFALPLYAVTLTILERDCRQPSRKVYWTLALLVLWANVHGSASLGAGLVVLRGVLMLWSRRSGIRARTRTVVRPLGLIVGAPLALAITPYGFGSFAYYGSTLGNSALHRAVSEWQPLTSSPLVAIPFALLAATVVRSFLANRQGTTAWDWFALLTLGLASITVIRNAPFFGLAALSLAPGRRRLAGDSRAADDGAVNRRINGAVLIGAVAVSALSITVALSGRAAPRTGAYAASALPNTLERALRADPHLTVAADTRYGDWLLWQLPSLAGRLAIDARYELYPSGVVTDYLDFVNASGRHWSRAASGHRLVILDRTADGSSVRRLAREPGARILFVDQHVIVILRRTSARGAGTA